MILDGSPLSELKLGLIIVIGLICVGLGYFYRLYKWVNYWRRSSNALSDNPIIDETNNIQYKNDNIANSKIATELLFLVKFLIMGFAIYISFLFIDNGSLRHYHFKYNFLFCIACIVTAYSYRLLKSINDTKRIGSGKEEEGSALTKVITKKNKITGESKEVLVYDTFSGAWHFTDFVNNNGPKLEIALHRNDRTKEEYKTLEVINSNGNSISIRFHSSLGELTSSQIKDRKNELWVVKRKDNNLYYLIDNNYEEWFEFLVN